MKKYLILLSIIISLSGTFYIFTREEKLNTAFVNKIIQNPAAIGTKENPTKRFDFELKQIIDPKTGTVPDFIHQKELKFSKNIPTHEDLKQSINGRTQAQVWETDGPSNIGGRTRALALDILNENIILAGGVSGGMWKSINSGISWTRTSHPNTLNSSTCLIQDTRSGKENIWYQGTGELIGNSAGAPGAPYRGDGIFKSTDNGDSWNLIPSTTNNRLSIFESPFNYIWNIVINTNRTDIDEIFAAVYGGIVRSQDGGNTWTTVLGDDLLNFSNNNSNGSNSPVFTNIIQTESGIFYATISVFPFNKKGMRDRKGIFRSTEGENWENISPGNLTPNHKRTVMDFATTNNDLLYFFVDDAIPQLWRYDDSSTSSKWQNKTNNLPPKPVDFVEGLDTQKSFNMMIKIHPNNENIIFLGGTNLFRSTDGFTSSNNTTWIGGYSTENNFSKFPGHHPDQHDLIFHPSNPNKSISAHDGGLSITFNNLSNQINWLSLNNNYITSQFYTISISPDKGNDAIIGGMQDNGSYAKNTTIENIPWNFLAGGDGSFCAITPKNIFWYVSNQNNNIFRLTLNNQFEYTSFAQVDPVGGTDYLFINPFVLDPNNYNRMYLAGGKMIWRNDNLSQIKSGVMESTNVNWIKLNRSIQPNTQISALDISTIPKNILYYGTVEGKVNKIINAHFPNYKSSFIFFNSGYISCIAIDPSNADNILVIYSNYNIPSIFFSNNGGNTFTDVGGNLEENTDGTGNGPSIRWGEIIPMADGSYQYFVGTSTGLYSTNLLDNENTIWAKEGTNVIGNSVIKMMDYRLSDGKMVIATHGNGVFETFINNILNTNLKKNISVNNIFPNPFNDTNPVRIDFNIPETGVVRIDILNNLGQYIKTILFATQFSGNNVALWDGTNNRGKSVRNGMYHYRMAYSNKVTTGKIIFNK